MAFSRRFYPKRLTTYRCRSSKDVHRNKCQANPSPYTTEIARVRYCTMLSKHYFKCNIQSVCTSSARKCNIQSVCTLSGRKCNILYNQCVHQVAGRTHTSPMQAASCRLWFPHTRAHRPAHCLQIWDIRSHCPHIFHTDLRSFWHCTMHDSIRSCFCLRLLRRFYP